MAQILKIYSTPRKFTRATDLTAKGLLGWRTFGSTNNYKSSGTSDIPAPTITGTPAYSSDTQWETSSWSNGTPNASGSGNGDYVAVQTTGDKIALSIPAPATARTIKLTCGVYAGSASVTAWLSNDSGNPVSVAITNSLGSAAALVTIHFQASDSSSRTLEIEIAPNPTGYVTLHHAWLYGAVVQENFRVHKDDGDENDATWYAAQDTNPTVNTGQILRPRFLISAAEDAPTQSYVLMERTDSETDADLEPVETAASGYKTIQLVNQLHVPTHVAEGAGTQAGTITITQATLNGLSVAANDYVSIAAVYYGNAVALTIAGGGQTWTQATQANQGTTVSSRESYCKFNGTWSANVTVTPASGSESLSVLLTVWRNVDGTSPRDVALTSTGGDGSGGPNYTVTGPTTSTNKAVAVIIFASSDDNGWGTSTANWHQADGAYGVRNNGGSDTSIQLIYREVTTAGATGSVVGVQKLSTGDPWTAMTYAWKPAAKTNPIYVTASSHVTDGEATTAQLVKG